MLYVQARASRKGGRAHAGRLEGGCQASAAPRSDGAGGDRGVRSDRSVAGSLEAFQLDEPRARQSSYEFIDGPPICRQDFVVEWAYLIGGETAGDEDAVIRDGSSEIVEGAVQL